MSYKSDKSEGSKKDEKEITQSVRYETSVKNIALTNGVSVNIPLSIKNRISSKNSEILPNYNDAVQSLKSSNHVLVSPEDSLPLQKESSPMNESGAERSHEFSHKSAQSISSKSNVLLSQNHTNPIKLIDSSLLLERLANEVVLSMIYPDNSNIRVSTNDYGNFGRSNDTPRSNAISPKESTQLVKYVDVLSEMVKPMSLKKSSSSSRNNVPSNNFDKLTEDNDVPLPPSTAAGNKEFSPFKNEEGERFSMKNRSSSSINSDKVKINSETLNTSSKSIESIKYVPFSPKESSHALSNQNGVISSKSAESPKNIYHSHNDDLLFNGNEMIPPKIDAEILSKVDVSIQKPVSLKSASFSSRNIVPSRDEGNVPENAHIPTRVSSQSPSDIPLSDKSIIFSQQNSVSIISENIHSIPFDNNPTLLHSPSFTVLPVKFECHPTISSGRSQIDVKSPQPTKITSSRLLHKDDSAYQNGCDHYRCWMVILIIAALSFIIGHLLHDVIDSLVRHDPYSFNIE